MMGVLVPFSVTLQMRWSLMMTEIILFPWEGRYMLKSNIKLRSSFYFQITIFMQ